MATSHHGEGRDNDLMRRFLDQVEGKAVREFPHGRVAADDEGATTYAIATDLKHGIIRIQFPVPTSWIGLDLESAVMLRDQLSHRIDELHAAEPPGKVT